MDWLLPLTLLLGFYMAWNIGANDVANAMGTSVGSKALTIKKAVILAALFEFCGALFVGSHVSETIQHEIVLPEIFADHPMDFVIGMMGSLVATGLMLQLASYIGLPISTTHAIVGAVVGFGAVIGGVHAIQWKEVVWIATSWVVSPFLSAFLSYGMLKFLQRKIFFSSDPMRATHRLVPLLASACIFIASMSLCYHGLASLHLDLSPHWSLPISLSLGGLIFLVSSLLLRRMPLMAASGTLGGAKQKNYLGVEEIFIYLQIITACLVAFAHGANDVANAIGPVAAAINVLKTQTLQSHDLVPSWLLVLGGGGIVLGLATWGWRVIKTVGEKITELTPMRGFCAEFGTAVTVLLASKLGLPISTTHALVGAVLGVGMTRGLQALNLQMVKGIVLSWIVTIPLCALTSILAFYVLRAVFL